MATAQYREKWDGDFFFVIAGDELIAGTTTAFRTSPSCTW
jgi:hypothetical protein